MVAFYRNGGLKGLVVHRLYINSFEASGAKEGVSIEAAKVQGLAFDLQAETTNLPTNNPNNPNS